MLRRIMSNISADSSKGVLVRLRVTIGTLELRGRQPGARFAVQWSKGKSKETTEIAPLNQQGVCTFNETVDLSTTLREERPKAMRFRLQEEVHRGKSEDTKLVPVLEHDLDLSAVYFTHLHGTGVMQQDIPFQTGMSFKKNVKKMSKKKMLKKNTEASTLTITVQLLSGASSMEGSLPRGDTQEVPLTPQGKREWKRRLTELYHTYRDVADPRSPEEIDGLVTAYVGEESDFYDRLKMKYEAMREERRSTPTRALSGVREEDSTEDTSHHDLSPSPSSLSSVSLASHGRRNLKVAVPSIDHEALLAEAALNANITSDSDNAKSARRETVVKTPTQNSTKRSGTFASAVVITEEAEGLSLSFGNILPSDDDLGKREMAQTAGVGGLLTARPERREHRHTLPVGKVLVQDLAAQGKVSSPPSLVQNPNLLSPSRKTDSPKKTLVGGVLLNGLTSPINSPPLTTSGPATPITPLQYTNILGLPVHSVTPSARSPPGMGLDDAVMEHTSKIISGRPRALSGRVLSGTSGHIVEGEEVRSTPASTPQTMDLRFSPGRSDLGEGSSDDEEVEGGPLDPRDPSGASGFYVRKPNYFVVRAARREETPAQPADGSVFATQIHSSPKALQAPERMSWRECRENSVERLPVGSEMPQTRPTWGDVKCDLGGAYGVGVGGGGGGVGGGIPQRSSWKDVRDGAGGSVASATPARPSVASLLSVPQHSLLPRASPNETLLTPRAGSAPPFML